MARPLGGQRRALSLGASLLTLGLVGVAGHGEQPAVQDPDVVGDWLLVEMSGNGYRGYRTPLGEPPVFSFDASGGWDGTDGCNDLTGTFTLGAGGAFAAEVVSTTDVDCDLSAEKTIPAIAVLESTATADVNVDVLELRDDSGDVAARFTRRAP